MCSRNDICFPGCQQSCGFYLQRTISDVASSVDSFRLKFLKPIQFTDRSGSLLLSWTRPSGENDINNVVYSVLKRNRIVGESDPKWLPLTQTSELSVEVNPKTLPPTSPIVDFKIIAVTGNGQVGQLVNSYHSMAMFRDEEMSGRTSTSSPQLQPTTISGTQLGSTPVTAPEGVVFLQGQDPQILPRWKLYLVALEHNPQLGSVDAVVTWAAPGLTGNFLVTWEVKEGTFAITGHLYTDSTTVTLSLWPATTYSVQVELVSGTLGKAIRSEPLTVNTDSISGPTHYRKEDNDMSVVAAPVKECTNTLVIASIAVAASLTVFVVGCFVLIRRCRGKKAQQSPNIVDNKLQRLGAIRRKIILSPLPIDVEGVCPIPTTTAMSSPPISSSLDERMSTFRGFLNENMVDSLSSSSVKSGSVIFSFPQVNDTTGLNRLQFGHLSKDKLLSSSEDCRLVENVFENHLPTENLLTKSRTIRSHSTAI